jgi:hypothetical protein
MEQIIVDEPHLPPPRCRKWWYTCSGTGGRPGPREEWRQLLR